MRLIYLLVFLCIGQVSLAQSDYQTLLPEGKIPLDFTQQSTFKYIMDVASIDKEDGRFDRKNKEKFLLESNFGIDEFLLSGKVLFNDPVTVYLNKVLDEILKNDADTRRNVRVYAVKSSVPNAFATNSGIIFVNIGLLAKLENEAQLAYILSHEVVHFQKKHVVNSYVKNERIVSGKDDYKGFSEDQKKIASTSYSKELEIEADLEGFEIYEGTAYNKDSLHQVFDMLARSDQLILDSEFDYTIFEHEGYRLPEDVKLTEFETYEFDEAYDDEESTHPNTATRKQNIDAKLQTLESGKGRDYVYPQSQFEDARRLALYELCRQLLLEHDDVNALYLAYDLLQDDPESVYLQKSMAKALYGATFFSFDSKKRVFVSPETQKVAHFFQTLRGRELKILALKHLYTLSEQYPDDKELTLMVKNLVFHLYKDDADIDKKLFEAEGEEVPYYVNAFSEAKDIEKLKEIFAQFKPKDVSGKKGKKKKKGPAKVAKTLVMTPTYIKVNQRKKDMIRYADGEDVLVEMDDKIRHVSKKLKMDNTVLNANDITRDDIEAFRTHAVLNEWLNEKFNGDELIRVSPIHNEMQAVLDQYDQDHLTLMASISIKEKVQGKGAYIAMTVLMPVFAPVTLPALVSPKYTYHMSVTFDAATEMPVSADLRAMKFKDTNSLMESNLYYSLFKLKHGKR